MPLPLCPAAASPCCPRCCCRCCCYCSLLLLFLLHLPVLLLLLLHMLMLMMPLTPNSSTCPLKSTTCICFTRRCRYFYPLCLAATRSTFLGGRVRVSIHRTVIHTYFKSYNPHCRHRKQCSGQAPTHQPMIKLLSWHQMNKGTVHWQNN